MVVCSVHKEVGVATAAELLWLLERLRPDVLFLEHSSADISAFLDGSCGTLESAAVMRYRNAHAVELVPVDVPVQVAEFKQKADDLFDRIDEASPKFCQLNLENFQYTANGGLAYLNSSINAYLESEIQREMRATVDALGDPDLAELYALWTRVHDLRETAMLGGVEAFARKTSFRKGVLLVGAGHRQALFDKSHLPRSDGRFVVTWDFAWQLDEEALDSDAEQRSDTAHRGAPGE